jgi:hypothetical protein
MREVALTADDKTQRVISIFSAILIIILLSNRNMFLNTYGQAFVCNYITFTFVHSPSACRNRLSTRPHKAFLALYPLTCRSMPR